MKSLQDYEAAFDSLKSSTSRLADELVNLGQHSGSASDGLHAAIILKEHNCAIHTDTLFGMLRSKWPNDEAVQYEYIQYLRFVGRDKDADDTLAKLAMADVAGDNILRELIARSFVDLSLPDRKRCEVRGMLLGLLARRPSLSNLNIVRYLSNVDVSSILDRCRHRKIGDVATVHAQCLHAIRTKTPFCLLRLGDGEGAFLHSPRHSHWEADLLESHRGFFTARWYNDYELAIEVGFLQVVDNLCSTVKEADVIGVPTIDWMLQEVRLRNLPTIINCLQVLRLVEDLEISDDGLCGTSIALDLEFHGYFHSLLEESGPITLITSHSALGDHLIKSRRATIRQTIAVPPAYSDCLETRYDLRSSHFRDAFQLVLRTIDLTISVGDVVLVAAGFLGKIYALRVKQRGGIALDIGSLADLWMGHMTRPAFRNLRELELAKPAQHASPPS